MDRSEESSPTAERIEVRLRLGTLGDREFLWRLHCLTMRGYVEKTWGWDEAWQRVYFDQNVDPSAIQVVERDGISIGCISVRRSSDEIYLAAIEITPAHQNQGVATQLIRELLDESDRSRLPVKLRVLKVNPARLLYERLGFLSTGETATHFTMVREPPNHD